MENGFLSFLREYWLCVLLSIIMVIGMFLSTIYANLYKSGSESDMIRFNLKEMVKKFLLILTVVVMLLPFASCGAKPALADYVVTYGAGEKKAA